MGSYRNAYPSGAASASAAYHYTGDSHEASVLGLRSRGERGLLSNPLGLGGRSSLYSYDLTVHNTRDLNGGGLLPLPFPLSETYRRGLHAPDGDVDIGGVAVYAGAGLHEGMHGSELCSRTFLTDFPSLDPDTRAFHGRTLYPAGSSSCLFSARADARNYAHISDSSVGSTHYKQQVERTPPAARQGPRRKRKTPSLDEIIRETWELHSLYRAGLGDVSDVTESSTDEIRPRSLPTSNECATRWNWTDPCLHEEPSDKTWQLSGKGLFGNTSSWKDLDAQGKKMKGTFSNNKQEDSSLELDREHELQASDMQRFTYERVVEFMGKYSDDDSSDNDSFVDSDDDTPNVIAESSCDVKSREERAFEFFLQTFMENKELQKLYNEQCHVGKFECLVCSSIPGKPPKKYNGLISVIMHASKIIKTKRKQEHRGYARALCSVMGWDLCRLPAATTHTSSPHPRCCIPTHEEENMEAKIGDGIRKETESDNSERASDSS